MDNMKSNIKSKAKSERSMRVYIVDIKDAIEVFDYKGYNLKEITDDFIEKMRRLRRVSERGQKYNDFLAFSEYGNITTFWFL